MNRLDKKSALVFGAGPNIGGTIAYFLAREGANVAVMDVSKTQAEETAAFIGERGHAALAITGDGTDEADILRAYETAEKAYGSVDIVVNLVAVAGGRPVGETSLEQWNHQIKGSLTSGMLTSKYALHSMARSRSKGSIIHILSTGAHYGHPGNPAYTAAKAGLLNFARAVAMEGAHLSIRCNTITPIGMEHNLWTVRKGSANDPRSRADGSIQGALDLNRRVEPDPANPKTRYNYSFEDVLQNIPLGRLPRCSDVAWAAVFLASDESQFVTGIDMPIDGGVRARYPIWRPGDYTGITLESYLRTIEISEYGEGVARFHD